MGQSPLYLGQTMTALLQIEPGTKGDVAAAVPDHVSAGVCYHAYLYPPTLSSAIVGASVGALSLV